MTRESQSCPFCGFRTWDGQSCTRCHYTHGKNPPPVVSPEGLRFPIRVAALLPLLRISREWLRACERKGLIPPPARNEKGHRIYTAEEVQRIRTILDRREP